MSKSIGTKEHEDDRGYDTNHGFAQLGFLFYESLAPGSDVQEPIKKVLDQIVRFCKDL
jgi:hypothetical protein